MREIEMLISSARELKNRAELHQGLLAKTIGGEEGLEMDSFTIPKCRQCRILRENLAEAIEVIEGTRKAFKSKQLEVLRKNLIKVMVDGQ